MKIRHTSYIKIPIEDICECRIVIMKKYYNNNMKQV